LIGENANHGFQRRDSGWIPPIQSNGIGNTNQGNDNNDQGLSDNESETGSASRQDQSEAQKAFRHVLRAPNPEKFSGDKKSYHLWKTSLYSEVEHIDMTPDMWLKLLKTRTSMVALEIIQESRRAQEMIGPHDTLSMIWQTFEKQYAAERTPDQDF